MAIFFSWWDPHSHTLRRPMSSLYIQYYVMFMQAGYLKAIQTCALGTSFIPIIVQRLSASLDHQCHVFELHSWCFRHPEQQSGQLISSPNRVEHKTYLKPASGIASSLGNPCQASKSQVACATARTTIRRVERARLRTPCAAQSKAAVLALVLDGPWSGRIWSRNHREMGNWNHWVAMVGMFTCW